MQPALNKTTGVRGAPQRIFQRCQRTDHANEGFGSNEQDGNQMRKPKPEIAHETQPHPCANPDQGKASHHEKRKQEMDDKYEIGQRHVNANIFGNAKE